MSGGEELGESKFRKRLSQYDLRLDIEAASTESPEKGRFFFPSPGVAGAEAGSSSDEEVAEEGKELFENFVREEIRREGLTEHAVRHCFTPVVVSTPRGYKNPLWAKTGRELRAMADAFSKTKERRQVLHRANQVGISDISYNQFRDLLSEFFLVGGITCERIVVLFFFCSDVAIRSLRQSAIDCFKNFMEWTARFIREKIVHWVQDHGGWAAVVRTSVKQISNVTILVGVAILSVCFFQWVKRRLQLKI